MLVFFIDESFITGNLVSYRKDETGTYFNGKLTFLSINELIPEFTDMYSQYLENIDYYIIEFIVEEYVPLKEKYEFISFEGSLNEMSLITTPKDATVFLENTAQMERLDNNKLKVRLGDSPDDFNITGLASELSIYCIYDNKLLEYEITWQNQGNKKFILKEEVE